MKRTILYVLHGTAFAIHLTSFILSFAVHDPKIESDIKYPVHSYLKTNDSLSIKTEYETDYSLSAVVLVTVNEGFTFASHMAAIMLLTCLKDLKIKTIEAIRRTAEYSLTAGILQVALVVSVGDTMSQDIIFLLVINVAIQLLGYISDKNGDMWLFITAFALLATEIWYVVIHVWNVNGIEDMTYYSLMGGAYAFFYIAFGLVKVIPFLKSIQDELYILMSVTSKVSLSWILIGNIYQGFEDFGQPLEVDIEWKTMQTSIVITSAAILVVGTGVLKWLEPRDEARTKVVPEKPTFKRLRY